LINNGNFNYVLEQLFTGARLIKSGGSDALKKLDRSNLIVSTGVFNE
jgi:hypothetical protein